MKCPNCGGENPDQASFCAACGRMLAAGYAATPPAAPAPKKNRTMLYAVVVILVAIVAVAAVAVGIMTSAPSFELTDASAVRTLTGDVDVTVTVSNTGGSEGSVTIVCEVTAPDSTVYTASREVSLDAGETGTYVITVDVPITYILDEVIWEAHLE